ncbi:hypothetical protein ACJX0J_001694, partial (mitochondrion) [Zea mays]
MDGMGRSMTVFPGVAFIRSFLLYLFYFSTSATGGDRLIRKAIKDAHLRKFNVIADHIDGKSIAFWKKMDENTGKNESNLDFRIGLLELKQYQYIISGTFTLLYFTLLYSSNHTITIIFPLEMVFCAKTTSSDFAEGNSNLDFEYRLLLDQAQFYEDSQAQAKYFLVGEEPISFHLTHSILFKEDSLSDSRDMQASWAGH